MLFALTVLECKPSDKEYCKCSDTFTVHFKVWGFSHNQQNCKKSHILYFTYYFSVAVKIILVVGQAQNFPFFHKDVDI
jgi:hypothetical protein